MKQSMWLYCEVVENIVFAVGVLVGLPAYLQEIHQIIQILSNDARTFDSMNRLTVLKNDIKELCQEEIDHEPSRD